MGPTVDDWRGFDTETQNGRAVLLATEAADFVFPRSFRAICQWLAGQGRYLGAWNAEYDFRAIFSYLGRGSLRRLALRGSVKLGRIVREEKRKGYRKPVREISIHHIPKKELIIKLNHSNKRKDVSLRLYDFMSFYQKGLDKAAKEYLSEGKDEIPREWLTRIGDILRAGGPDADKVRSYCRRDAGLALRLGQHLMRAFGAAGIDFSRPLSPGYVAGRYFARRLTKRDDDYHRVTVRGFAGGRIEIWQRGRIGPVSGYDIRSAYPSRLATLIDPGAAPLIRTGEWTESATYGVYLCRVELDLPLVYYRATRAGLVIFPVGTWLEWYGRDEIQLIRERGGFVQILDAWEVQAPTNRSLFPEIADWYLRRKRDPVAGMAYKLAMNSLYGKLGSSISRYVPRGKGGIRSLDKYVNGKFWRRIHTASSMTDYLLASAVTADCRCRLTRYALAADRSDVVLLATDGILFRRRGAPKLGPVGPELGALDGPTQYADALVIGAGVYALDEAGAWKNKSRGFRIREQGIDLFSLARRAEKSTTLETPDLRAKTLGQAFARENFESFNALVTFEQHKDVNADNKRDWEERFSCGKEATERMIPSRPWRVMETQREGESRLRAQGRWEF